MVISRKALLNQDWKTSELESLLFIIILKTDQSRLLNLKLLILELHKEYSWNVKWFLSKMVPKCHLNQLILELVLILAFVEGLLEFMTVINILENSLM